jgi:transposase
MASQRKSYTFQKKLLVLAEYQKGVDGYGIVSLAKKFGLSHHTLPGWIKNQEKLANTVQDRDVETRRSRRLEGGGRKTSFGSLEEKLHNWVKDKNRKGLKVKDQYMKQKALTLH